MVDLIPLAIGEWLVGWAVGRDVPRSTHRRSKPWLAVLLVASGFVAVHGLGTTLGTDLLGSRSGLLLAPGTSRQIAVLAALGVWAGGMFVVLCEGPSLDSVWARVAFFSFGVFGLSWTWFHLLFVIEFAGVLHEVLLVGLIGAVGVFAGAFAYERFVRTIL